MNESRPLSTSPPKIVVCGPCASGKTTLVAGLKQHGYEAYVCGQEHSDIRSLWNHLEPDVVIALRLDFATLRARRGDDWSASIYRLQLQRLAGAYARADVILDSARLDRPALLRGVIGYLESKFVAPLDGN